MSSKQDANVSRIVVVGSICSVLLVVLLVGLQAWYYGEQAREREEKVVEATDWKLSSIRMDQLETIHSYRWVDQKNGRVAIPIDRAMELVLEDLGHAGSGAATGIERREGSR
jgi:hypothetical protein